MSMRLQITVAICALLVAFSAGRYSAGGATVKTVETKVAEADKTQDIKTHTETTITTVKTPDGTVKTVEQIQTVADDKIAEKDTSKTDLTQTVTPPKTGTGNISLLVSNDFTKGLLIPAYGISVTKEVLGPITVGAFGLTNGTIGLSLGVNF